MENIQELLQKKGYIGKNGMANHKALKTLSKQTTKNFVRGLYHHLIEDEISIILDICDLFMYLYIEGEDEKAAYLINFLRVFMRLDVSTDIKYVLDNEITQNYYIYEFIVHFFDTIKVLMAEAKIDYESNKNAPKTP